MMRSFKLRAGMDDSAAAEPSEHDVSTGCPMFTPFLNSAPRPGNADHWGSEPIARVDPTVGRSDADLLVWTSEYRQSGEP